MIEFKTPYQNNPFLPSIAYFCVWLFNALVLGWLLQYFSLSSLVTFSLISSGAFLAVGILSLYVIFAFLLTRRYKKFLISLVSFLLTSTLLNLGEVALAPFKAQSALKGVVRSESELGVPEDEAETQYFGSESPNKICYDEPTENGLRSCRVCACPPSSELVLVDRIPRCYFYDPVKGWTRSNGFIQAPCSPVTQEPDNKVVPPITSYASRIFYSVYKYRDHALETCSEYVTWREWNLKNAKTICEREKPYTCLVRVGEPCAPRSAKQICEKPIEKPNRVYRQVEYLKVGTPTDFDVKTQCKVVKSK